MVCVFRDKVVFINGKGYVYPDLCNKSTLDFEANESEDYREFYKGLNQYFMQGTANSLTQTDLINYAKLLIGMKNCPNSEVEE